MFSRSERQLELVLDAGKPCHLLKFAAQPTVDKVRSSFVLIGHSIHHIEEQCCISGGKDEKGYKGRCMHRTPCPAPLNS